MGTITPYETPDLQAYLRSMIAPGVTGIDGGQVLPTAIPVTQVPVPAPVVATPTPVVPTVQVPDPTPDPQTVARQQYRSQVENAFGADYGERNIGSSLLDDTINSILSEQKNNAASYLERGHKRGIYNDTGYNAGLSGIGAASEAGRSKLYSLGNSVIDKYRADANTVRDKAYSAASGWTPGSNFSLDPYINQGNEVIHRAQDLAPGDLRNSFGGTQLFDFGSLNNRAGQAQGAINTRDADVLSAVAARKRNNGLGRGLGSTGAF